VEFSFSYVLFRFKGFDNPNVFFLAEISYLFSLFSTIHLINKNLIVLTKDPRSILNKCTLLDGTKNMTPDERILVHVCVGTRNDSEDMMFD
jgi:hypothetical protein